jgi:hypothetical protein
MVGHRNQGDGTRQDKGTKLGYINENFAIGSICSKLLAEYAGMRNHFPIYRSETTCNIGSEIPWVYSFGMQLCIHTNNTLAVNDNYMIMCINYWP